MRPGAQMNPGI